MDKLNNVNRDGGYPIVSETLDILNFNNQTLLDFFDGLNLPTKTIIFIKSSRDNTGFITVSLVYVREGLPHGKICKTNFRYERESFDNLKIAAQISAVNHDFSDGVKTYENVYTAYTAAITTVAAEWYKVFATVSDALSYSIDGEGDYWRPVGGSDVPFYSGYAAGDDGLYFKKIADDKVRLRGSVTPVNWNPESDDFFIFRLPGVYRPVSAQYFAVPSAFANTSCIKINTNGKVEIFRSASMQTPPIQLYLDSVEFVIK